MPWTKKSDSCHSARPHLWDYIAGSLPDASPERERIEAHLTRCPRCRAEAEMFRVSAAAMAAYTAAPETGIPPRAPDWETVQARLGEREKQGTVAGVPWLRAVRTSPAFAGATLGLGLCTALCAVSIPWALGQQNKKDEAQANLGGKPASVAASVASVQPARPAVPVEMSVRQIFHTSYSAVVRAGESQVLPLSVVIINHTGKADAVRLTVATASGLSTNRYERSVSIKADSKPQIVLLYPSVSGSFTSYQRQELRVRMTGSFPVQETSLSYDTGNHSMVTMGLISGARSGSLLPKEQVIEPRKKQVRDARGFSYTYSSNQNAPYRSAFTRPELAPDRPVGYDDITTMVLAEGADQLSAVQRAALRQWVMGGGSVILLPGAGLDLLGIAPGSPSVNTKPPSSSAHSEFASRLLPPDVPVRRYRLGMGTVLTVPVDLTQNEFRERWELPYAWDDLRNRAAPLCSAESLHQKGIYAAFDQETGYNDPFQIALPPLATVVYLFAGYFLLAVPVTFVVLKQTRRMNWAWATGPALAAVFGGAVYGFTADLHKAKLSRRTTGIMVSAAGEKQARFSGTSELFFPSSGSYDVTVPGAEAIALAPPAYQESIDWNSGENPPRRDRARREGSGIISRSLETVDNGTSISVPALAVPNLAFRCLSHTQPVAWGDGITANLVQEINGSVTGTIHNGTGRTLNKVYILLPNRDGDSVSRDSPIYQRPRRMVVLCSRIAPGTTELNYMTEYNQEISEGTGSARYDVSNDIAAYFTRGRFLRPGDAPVLIATTSGQDLGPTIGQYVGGSDTVTVAVTLPPIPKAGNPAIQGGVK